MYQKHLGFIFNIIAIALFVPGIILPMISINMEMTANMAQSALSSTLVNKELSILATVQDLFYDDRLLVAFLILFFSVIVPVLKTSLLCSTYFVKNPQTEQTIISWLNSIGKWSMADVFVVAIFLAILSTNHAETANQQSFALFGFKLDLIISSQTLSAAGAGFYYFTGYCLLSLLGTHLAQQAFNKNKLKMQSTT
ncbi:paraquat-inducible protein A [Catenovulum sp. 2E275]|uniref:paraquat-inducible protein A n=1 Tax=Catenovulum sp. 2E275 TaxID=2980497 RepID=UPI0021CF9B11|nr:paraquat-inducible protein A [Catenovulum sp. 2E275]MCU4676114.1 paraquat-inducible protein A [Catenovulum sp. 2E275]